MALLVVASLGVGCRDYIAPSSSRTVVRYINAPADSFSEALFKGLAETLPEIDLKLVTTRYVGTKFPALLAVDINQASATAIPLHDGAARYYRESELL